MEVCLYDEYYLDKWQSTYEWVDGEYYYLQKCCKEPCPS